MSARPADHLDRLAPQLVGKARQIAIPHPLQVCRSGNTVKKRGLGHVCLLGQKSAV